MKLPEPVEWLERNYDEGSIRMGGDLFPDSGIRVWFWWYPEARNDVGSGAGYMGPMFSLKPDADGGPEYRHFPSEHEALSLESEHNSMWGDEREALSLESERPAYAAPTPTANRERLYCRDV